MNGFVFFTYVLALIGIAVSLYTLYQIECVKENMNEKKAKRPKKSLPPIKVSRGKGHWD
jgi:hypothetical protein